MLNSFEDVLKGIGLTQYEAKIYLAMLEIGEGTTGEILKKAGVHTGKVYEILHSLRQKGLASMVISNKTKNFSAAPPSVVSQLVEEKKKVLLKEESIVNKMIHQLMGVYDQNKPETKIEVYKGIKGIWTVYQREFELAKKAGFTYVLGINNKQHYSARVLRLFAQRITPQRQKLGIKIKKILNTDAKEFRKNHEKNAEVRYYPFASSVGFNVTKGFCFISIYSESEPILIVIESENVSKTFIEQFNIVWKLAKEE